jgi:hypothetical protein
MRKPVHHPNFLELVHKLKPVLRQHPPLAVMYFDDLADWISWYWNRGTMSWVINEDGEARGICLIRMFRRLEQFMEPIVHDPCGKFCMIELIVSSDPIVTGQLFSGLVDRWGPQETMLWDRGTRTENGAPRMYKWDQFIKLSRRLSYGITEDPRSCSSR